MDSKTYGLPTRFLGVIAIAVIVGVVAFLATSPESEKMVSAAFGHAYHRGDLVRIEYDGYKAVYRVNHAVENDAETMYDLIATDDAGMLPSLSVEESSIRLADDHRR